MTAAPRPRAMPPQGRIRASMIRPGDRVRYLPGGVLHAMPHHQIVTAVDIAADTVTLDYGGTIPARTIIVGERPPPAD